MKARLTYRTFTLAKFKKKDDEKGKSGASGPSIGAPDPTSSKTPHFKNPNSPTLQAQPSSTIPINDPQMPQQPSKSTAEKSHIREIIQRIQLRHQNFENDDHEAFDDTENSNVNSNVILEGGGPSSSAYQEADFGHIKTLKVGSVTAKIHKNVLKKKQNPGIDENLFSLTFETSRRPKNNLLLSKVEKALFKSLTQILVELKVISNFQ